MFLCSCEKKNKKPVGWILIVAFKNKVFIVTCILIKSSHLFQLYRSWCVPIQFHFSIKWSFSWWKHGNFIEDVPIFFPGKAEHIPFSNAWILRCPPVRNRRRRRQTLWRPRCRCRRWSLLNWCYDIWRFPSIWVPPNGWFILENPNLKWMI